MLKLKLQYFGHLIRRADSFAGVRSRIDDSNSPKCFKGLPVTLIAASIVALAFYGFAGIVENLLA